MSVLTPRLRGGAPGLPTDDERERLRALLCAMEDAIQEHVIRARDDASMEDLSHIESVTDSDTIYYIDRVSEEAILRWFEQHWPSDLATILVMEGLPDSRPTVFPADIPEASARFVCIVDPIDGTRGLMYDKRSAWVLAGVAPNLGLETTLADIEVAVMTELPVTKQRLVDQLSAVKGKGPAGVIAERSSRTISTTATWASHVFLLRARNCSRALRSSCTLACTGPTRSPSSRSSRIST
ncbi:MAG: hypothetical protein JRG94_24895, partial [Deltaproteobacteria bacterium]|nr:hypothetical protein [Deltaproteobacteria bacterium]